MDENYVFLIKKEEMWARMLLQILRDNGIPAATLPVHGAGVVLKTGMQEELEIYVAPDRKADAEAIVRDLFSGEYT